MTTDPVSIRNPLRVEGSNKKRKALGNWFGGVLTNTLPVSVGIDFFWEINKVLLYKTTKLIVDK